MRGRGGHCKRSQEHNSTRIFQNVFCELRLHELGMELFNESHKIIFRQARPLWNYLWKAREPELVLPNQFYAALAIFLAPKRGGPSPQFSFGRLKLPPPPPPMRTTQNFRDKRWLNPATPLKRPLLWDAASSRERFWTIFNPLIRL